MKHVATHHDEHESASRRWTRRRLTRFCTYPDCKRMTEVSEKEFRSSRYVCPSCKTEAEARSALILSLSERVAVSQ